MSELDYAVTGLPSLRALTKVASQPRVIKTLSWHEWRKAEKSLLGNTRYATKAVMAQRVYKALYEPCGQEPLTHTGWHLRPGDVVSIATESESGDRVAPWFAVEQRKALHLWRKPVKALKIVWTSDEDRANILVRFDHLDGRGGVLGMTLRYSEGDLGRNGQQVIVTVDLDEFWTPDYFRTVFAHEIGHALGHGHYRLGNLMYDRFVGVRNSLGPQDRSFHLDKYGYLSGATAFT